MSPDHAARGSGLDNIYGVTLSAAAITALTNLNTAYTGQVLILTYEDHVLANSDKHFIGAIPSSMGICRFFQSTGENRNKKEIGR